MPKASVIVRSKNDAPFIKKTLDAILTQRFKDFEILNIDSGSTDGTLEIIQRYKEVKSQSIKPEDYVPGKVLNLAVRESSGEIIVFNNSDCVPQNCDWLGNLIKALEESPGTAAVYGKQIPRPDARPLVIRDYAAAFGDGSAAAKWRHFFSLATAAAPRALLLERPFNEDLRYSEDIEWSWRMRQAGMRVVYAPDAVVEHSHNYSVKELWKRFYNEGLADGFIYRERPGFVRDLAGPVIMGVLRDAAWLAARGLPHRIPDGIVYRTIQKLAAYSGRRAFFRSGGA